MAYEMTPPGFREMVVLTPEAYSHMLFRAAGQTQQAWGSYMLASRVAFQVQNFLEKITQASNIGQIFGLMPNCLNYGFDVADECAKAGPRGRVDLVRTRIEEMFSQMQIALVSGIWAGAGSTYSNLTDDWFQVGQLLYGYKTVAYHTAITPRMRRHWNYQYHPNYPDLGTAWKLWRRGKWTPDKVVEAGQMDGWSKELADLMVYLMQQVPTPREGFYMWRKGSINEAKYKSLLFMDGWEPEWYDAITENYWYTPTLYDLTRLADYVEMDQTWALKQMDRRGVKDEDKAIIWEMLRLRPLREEIRNLTTKWLWRYRYGRSTLDTLTDELLELELRAKERKFLVRKAQLDYEDEVIDEKLEILMWRFRNAEITEDEYLASVLALGINEEKANLIVELQVAMGYHGYY